ncbi:hypothetical protein R69608_01400 [Paraburkholderia nemoris]|uniref:hypothetical protein n=1 Tax=Paraburkholderia nemoris TaxID=2793076 RepID=UPI001911B6B7|nr:hypothetical protein [Paraburkholderia nemoris]MBK5148026.1 hypothetical protein [Burkholderia sp. R-69608]CAE6875979.1 hypothetical protein R69608_01400 [Paraburkholderia nemoris]
MNHIYAEIGRAVIASQTFEICFIATSEGVRMIADPDYRKNTEGYISDKAWKQRASEIVKGLAKDGAIDMGLEKRFLDLIENRNVLIHRWVMTHGISDDPDKEQPLLTFAKTVHAEADALTLMMAEYMIKHAYPEKYAVDQARMVNMFNLMHVDTKGSEG